MLFAILENSKEQLSFSLPNTNFNWTIDKICLTNLKLPVSFLCPLLQHTISFTAQNTSYILKAQITTIYITNETWPSADDNYLHCLKLKLTFKSTNHYNQWRARWPPLGQTVWCSIWILYFRFLSDVPFSRKSSPSLLTTQDIF